MSHPRTSVLHLLSCVIPALNTSVLHELAIFHMVSDDSDGGDNDICSNAHDLSVQVREAIFTLRILLSYPGHSNNKHSTLSLQL